MRAHMHACIHGLNEGGCGDQMCCSQLPPVCHACVEKKYGRLSRSQTCLGLHNPDPVQYEKKEAREDRTISITSINIYTKKNKVLLSSRWASSQERERGPLLHNNEPSAFYRMRFEREQLRYPCQFSTVGSGERSMNRQKYLLGNISILCHGIDVVHTSDYPRPFFLSLLNLTPTLTHYVVPYCCTYPYP